MLLYLPAYICSLPLHAQIFECCQIIVSCSTCRNPTPTTTSTTSSTRRERRMTAEGGKKRRGGEKSNGKTKDDVGVDSARAKKEEHKV